MSEQHPPADIVRRLYQVILDRKAHPRPDSYVCRLLERGPDRILQKFGEEAVEAVIAGKNPDDAALVRELADLVFHGLVLLGFRGIPPEEVARELERRFGISGLAEKAARGRSDEPGRPQPPREQVAHVPALRSFSDEGPAKVVLAQGGRARVTLWCLEPGQEIRPHTHGGDHVWVFHEGRGVVQAAGREHPVEPGSVVWVPAGLPHGVRAAERLVFVSVSAG